MPRLKFTPGGQKRTPGTLGAWGVASTQVPEPAAWATTNPVRPNPVRVGLFPVELKLTFVYAAI
jgi:hypothetical protein